MALCVPPAKPRSERQAQAREAASRPPARPSSASPPLRIYIQAHQSNSPPLPGLPRRRPHLSPQSRLSRVSHYSPKYIRSTRSALTRTPPHLVLLARTCPPCISCAPHTIVESSHLSDGLAEPTEAVPTHASPRDGVHSLTGRAPHRPAAPPRAGAPGRAQRPCPSTRRPRASSPGRGAPPPPGPQTTSSG